MKILILSFILTMAWGHGGGVVDNGGGLAEQNFLYALVQSQRFLDECISARGCSGYTPTQLQTLRDLSSAIQREPADYAQIKFKDPTEDPGYFDDNGRELAFKSPLSDKNYVVNRSMIYVKTGSTTRPMTVPEVLPLVFSVLAHSRLQMNYDDAITFFHAFTFNPARLSEQLVIGHRIVDIPVEKRPHISTWIFSAGHRDVTDLVITDFEKGHRIVCADGEPVSCMESDILNTDLELFNLNVDWITPLPSGFEVTLSANYTGRLFGRVEFKLIFDSAYRLKSWSM